MTHRLFLAVRPREVVELGSELKVGNRRTGEG